MWKKKKKEHGAVKLFGLALVILLWLRPNPWIPWVLSRLHRKLGKIIVSYKFFTRHRILASCMGVFTYSFVWLFPSLFDYWKDHWNHNLTLSKVIHYDKFWKLIFWYEKSKSNCFVWRNNRFLRFLFCTVLSRQIHRTEEPDVKTIISRVIQAEKYVSSTTGGWVKLRWWNLVWY